MYVQCDGINYTMLFDTKSFILNKQFNNPAGGTYTGFALQKKIEVDEIDPYQVQNVKVVGNSISIISRNTTIDNIGQTLVTYYSDADRDTKWPENLSIVRRKHGLASSKKVTTAWGSTEYQLYHTKSQSNDEEEIKVYKYKNNQIQDPPVTEIKLRDKSNSLSFDIYR